MELNNTSDYTDGNVNRLVGLAAELSRADLTKVHVNIKNCHKGAFAGRAYKSVPNVSNASDDAEHLVIVRIGSNRYFPTDNMTSSRRWKKVSNAAYNKAKNKYGFRSCSQTIDGKRSSWWEKEVIKKHPYGGKSSPFIQYKNWQEGLVAVAAHEFHHVYQFQNNLPCSEVECEKAALLALEAYRKTDERRKSR